MAAEAEVIHIQSLIHSDMDILADLHSALHEPSGNDYRLFKLMLKHFNDIAYQRLVAINLKKPGYELRHIEERAKSIYSALEKTCRLADQADRVVLDLDEKFKKGQSKVATGKATQRCTKSTQSLELLTSAVSQPSSYEAVNRFDSMLSQSFSAAEEVVHRRRHTRAATVPEADYNIAGGAEVAESNPTHPFQGRAIGTRRKATNIPRIFTGSFSQLESDIRKLQLGEVRTPEGQDMSREDPVKVRDFGATPDISRCTTPSPAALLQRREALLSKDSEFTDRVIKGEVISSRRPSTKGRALTIDDRTGGLEAWLKEESSATKVPNTPGSGGGRGYVRHRENTL